MYLTRLVPTGVLDVWVSFCFYVSENKFFRPLFKTLSVIFCFEKEKEVLEWERALSTTKDKRQIMVRTISFKF